MAINLYFLIVCILAGITVYFQKESPLYLKLLPALLAISFIVEMIASWMAQRYGNNVLIYNSYSCFELTFFLFLLREMVVGKIIRLILFCLVVVYPAYAVFNMYYIQPGEWHSYSYGIGNLLVIGVSMYYFFELFKRPKSINLIKEPAFWICSGLLFFYTCSFPFLGPMNILNGAPVNIIQSFLTIIAFVNILHYILFTIAFLCRINFKRPSNATLAQSPQ